MVKERGRKGESENEIDRKREMQTYREIINVLCMISK